MQHLDPALRLVGDGDRLQQGAGDSVAAPGRSRGDGDMGDDDMGDGGDVDDGGLPPSCRGQGGDAGPNL